MLRAISFVYEDALAANTFSILKYSNELCTTRMLLLGSIIF